MIDLSAKALLILVFALLAGLARGSEVVDLSSQLHSVQVGRFMEVLEDPSGNWILNDVIQPGRYLGPKGWYPLASDSLNSGFSRSAWWVRLTLRNTGQDRLDYLLDTQTTLADYLDFYVVRQGQVQVATATGDRRKFETRPLQSRNFVFPVTLEPGETQTLYLRQATHDGLHEVMTPILWDTEYFPMRIQNESSLYGAFYGAAFALLIYNLFLYFSTREKEVLYYLCYVISFVLWSVIFRGYSFQYLAPNSPDLNNILLAILSSLCFTFFCNFAIEFLEVRQSMRRVWYWLLRAIFFATLIPVIIALTGHYKLVFAVQIPVSFSLVIIATAAAVVQWRKGLRTATYYLLGFTWLAVGGILYFLRMSDVLESSPLTEYSVQVGYIFEVLVLGLGLADRMNEMKAEKLVMENHILEARANQAAELEKEVQVRTEQLEIANRKLEQQSIRDELTGIYNRRHFNELFDRSLASHVRHRTEFALCLLDLDYFKELNDQCGHQAGDEVLRQVTCCLQEHLKRANDHIFRLKNVFRVGGEEFALLLSVSGPEQHCVEFVDSIRKAIADLAIPHPGSPDQVVTASFGLLTMNEHSSALTVDEIYRKADDLLYQAKAEGKNRLIHQAV